MSKIKNRYHPYQNKELGLFIQTLEDQYSITDEIDFFSKLVNFSKNVDAPYHRWFKYREGFSHTLVSELIKRSEITPDEYVIDPFCGSGTTILEAKKSGYSGVGIDINPMSAFTSLVKCRNYSISEIQEIEDCFTEIEVHLYQEKLGEVIQEKYARQGKYFNSHNFQQLLLIRQVIERNDIKTKQKVFDFFLCAYLCIIEEVSDRKKDGNGLRTRISKVTNVIDHYYEQVKMMLDDIKNRGLESSTFSEVKSGKATHMVSICNDFIDSKIIPGVIIYSPPYPNSFDYFESYKMELFLGDFVSDSKELANLRGQAIHSFVRPNGQSQIVPEYITWMSQEIKDSIPQKEERTGKKDTRTRKVPDMIKGYFADMEEVVKQSSQVLSVGKKCYIVVDQSAYLGKIVPTDLFLAKIAENYGFDVEEIIVCRKARTSPQQLKLYPYLNDLLRESIVVLRKLG